MSNSVTPLRTDLRSEYNLACPQCGQADTLCVDITCTATLTIDGTDANGDHYWDDESLCSCYACNHHGKVAAFRVTASKAVQP